MDFKKNYQPYFFKKASSYILFTHFVFASVPADLVEAREQLVGITLLHPPCGFQGSSSGCGCQACRQAPLPTEPSCWPLSWVVLKQGYLPWVMGSRMLKGGGRRPVEAAEDSGSTGLRDISWMPFFLSHRCDNLDIFFRKKVPVVPASTGSCQPSTQTQVSLGTSLGCW